MSKVIASILLMWAGLSHATQITIDPDDFVTGGAITTASPYVTLTDGANRPVYSSEFQCNGLAAPTGTRVFGNSSQAGCHGWASEVGGPYPSSGGYSFVGAFSEAVSNVRLLAMNSGYPFDFAAEYSAYDQNFNELVHGRVDAPFGEIIPIDLAVNGVRYIDVGGFSSIGTLTLDRLTFDIPEPSAAGLMLIGTVAVIGFSLSRRRALPSLTS